MEALFGWLCDLRRPPDRYVGFTGTQRRSGCRSSTASTGRRGARTRSSGSRFRTPPAWIDTVSRDLADPTYFAPDRQNACNVLDVAHPLWLAARQTDHRRPGDPPPAPSSCWVDAVGALASLVRDSASTRPRPGAPGVPDSVPGLQGTEMWLAIIWLLADQLGLADVLGYRPRGVHRPEPALAPWAG